MNKGRTWWWLQQTEHILEQLWHVHSGKSSHCEIFEMIIRDPRFSSLIDHDKNHILWQYRWQGLSCIAIIESILYPVVKDYNILSPWRPCRTQHVVDYNTWLQGNSSGIQVVVVYNNCYHAAHYLPRIVVINYNCLFSLN